MATDYYKEGLNINTIEHQLSERYGFTIRTLHRWSAPALAFETDSQKDSEWMKGQATEKWLDYVRIFEIKNLFDLAAVEFGKELRQILLERAHSSRWQTIAADLVTRAEFESVRPSAGELLQLKQAATEYSPVFDYPWAVVVVDCMIQHLEGGGSDGDFRTASYYGKDGSNSIIYLRICTLRGHVLFVSSMYYPGDFKESGYHNIDVYIWAMENLDQVCLFSNLPEI